MPVVVPIPAPTHILPALPRVTLNPMVIGAARAVLLIEPPRSAGGGTVLAPLDCGPIGQAIYNAGPTKNRVNYVILGGENAGKCANDESLNIAVFPVEVRDDGRGLNRDKILAKARERLVDRPVEDQLDAEDPQMPVLVPGLTINPSLASRVQEGPSASGKVAPPTEAEAAKVPSSTPRSHTTGQSSPGGRRTTNQWIFFTPADWRHLATTGRRI